jgi:hypothetical protein
MNAHFILFILKLPGLSFNASTRKKCVIKVLFMLINIY